MKSREEEDEDWESTCENLSLDFEMWENGMQFTIETKNKQRYIPESYEDWE